MARAVRVRNKTTLDELRQRRRPVGRLEGGNTKVDAIIEAWEDVTRRALQFLDDKALAASTAKELADVASKGTQNVQLLKGMPTKIMGFAERANIEDVMRMALDEARRRKMVTLPPEDYSEQ